jgi:hypothetical protein
VDLWKAYNQMANDRRQLWYNGFPLFDPKQPAKFMFGTNLRTGFGGEDAPHGFGGKETRVVNYSIDQAVDRSGARYRLQAIWRNTLPETLTLPDGGMVVRAMRGNSVKDGDDEPVSEMEEGTDTSNGAWWPLPPGFDLAHPSRLMGTGDSSSKAAVRKMSCNNCYLDDVYGATIVAEKGPETVPGGETEDALAVAERLREEIVRGTIKQGRHGRKVSREARQGEGRLRQANYWHHVECDRPAEPDQLPA